MSWDFNAGEHAIDNTAIVDWNGQKGDLSPIPGETLQGVEFRFRGKHPNGDSTSEWRYVLHQPMQASWEYLKIYQPVNFFHRAITEIEAGADLSIDLWQKGDPVENERGMRAEVTYVDGTKLYIDKYPQRFDRNWGEGRVITNLRSGAMFNSVESTYLANNNKLSTQWQGQYSNAGVTVETEAILPAKGGENGVSYCRPTINRSSSHGSSGTVINRIEGKLAECFHPRDNGTVVELLIERQRSSSLTAKDGSYRIWKRTERTDWELIFSNTSVKIYQEENNHFDNGYVFGWANSGYNEDTYFYLLGWQLWDTKPAFLP
ncbi:hypothetical protein QTP81_03375 [Alteromonas sp. ASW11-36]|uniref:Polysaccharide lyase family 7 protein n=1 Tax=Alteromonas arenosi TaxID=3055817 RepID=A0ABT7STX0_9ALTE|nr:hypothetical protein [Alteromonas sp. ASW11-36]MDM7859648.1 hypothetical protein [Alteromonas sp. ASW11-36]